MVPMVRRFLWAFVGILFVILSGTVGFHLLEGLSFFDSFWMTMISFLTVGYGDLIPHTREGKVFALILIPLGIGLMTYLLGVLAAYLVEGDLSEQVRRRKMERAINSLRNHVIVCGFGRVGEQVVRQLQEDKVPLVVIDQDVGQLEKWDDPILYIEGDATDDHVLQRAGIVQAKGLIAALPQDAGNALIAITARGLNPAIHIVARAEKRESEVKLRRAGADKVINPSIIGGRRMALSILKPTSVDFIDTVFQAEEEAYNIEEMLLLASSPLAYHTLQEARIREKYGVTIIAIKRHENIISNPGAGIQLLPGDQVVVFGTPQQLLHFAQVTKG